MIYLGYEPNRLKDGVQIKSITSKSVRRDGSLGGRRTFEIKNNHLYALNVELQIHPTSPPIQYPVIQFVIHLVIPAPAFLL